MIVRTNIRARKATLSDVHMASEEGKVIELLLI